MSKLFLKLDGIQGYARDHAHGGEIEVLSWSWSASAPSPTVESESYLTDGGEINVGDLQLSKTTDASTPMLIRALAEQTVIPTAVLSCVADSGYSFEPVQFPIGGNENAVRETDGDAEYGDDEYGDFSPQVAADWFQIHMKDVQISDLGATGTGQMGDASEHLSLRFGSIRFQYYTFDASGFRDGDPVEFDWQR